MKPNDYRKCCIIIGDTPYQVEGGGSKGTHSATGVLKIGRVVWARLNEEHAPEQRTSVYAEGVGIVHVESRLLRPTSVAV